MRQRRTISLARNPGTLVRFTFHKACSRPDLHRHCAEFESAASAVGLRELKWSRRPRRRKGLGRLVGGRGSCTRTASVLSGVPLLIGLRRG